MGNISLRGMSAREFGVGGGKPSKFESIESFQFIGPFDGESNNGLYLNNTYLPQEIITLILSHVDAKELLKCTEVCKKWYNIIKSDTFWYSLYHTKHQNKKPKKLPWYVYYCFLTTNYFDQNLIKNGNGEERFNHWQIVQNYGDEFRVEDPPCGADPLPLNIPDFNGKTSCFATSYYECNKLQEISFENNRLMRWIMNNHRPHIYVSEWVAGRFDCGCVYNLWCKLYKAKDSSDQLQKVRNSPVSGSDSDYFEDDEEQPLHVEHTSVRVEQWEGSSWTKVELLIKDYPPGVARIVFQHEGKDTQFWKGHYGSKMAGGILKLLSDTIDEA